MQTTGLTPPSDNYDSSHAASYTGANCLEVTLVRFSAAQPGPAGPIHSHCPLVAVRDTKQAMRDDQTILIFRTTDWIRFIDDIMNASFTLGQLRYLWGRDSDEVTTGGIGVRMLHDNQIVLRNTATGGSETIDLTSDEWDAFLMAVLVGEFDLDVLRHDLD